MKEIIAQLNSTATALEQDGLEKLAARIDETTRSYLDIKTAQYVGVQGYWLRNSRCWGNCYRQKRAKDKNKAAQEIWEACHEEYLESLNDNNSGWEKYAEEDAELAGIFKLAGTELQEVISHVEQVEGEYLKNSLAVKLASGVPMGFAVFQIGEEAVERYNQAEVKVAEQLMQLAEEAKSVGKTDIAEKVAAVSAKVMQKVADRQSNQVVEDVANQMYQIIQTANGMFQQFNSVEKALNQGRAGGMRGWFGKGKQQNKFLENTIQSLKRNVVQFQRTLQDSAAYLMNLQGQEAAKPDQHSKTVADQIQQVASMLQETNARSANAYQGLNNNDIKTVTDSLRFIIRNATGYAHQIQQSVNQMRQQSQQGWMGSGDLKQQLADNIRKYVQNHANETPEDLTARIWQAVNNKGYQGAISEAEVKGIVDQVRRTQTQQQSQPRTPDQRVNDLKNQIWQEAASSFGVPDDLDPAKAKETIDQLIQMFVQDGNDQKLVTNYVNLAYKQWVALQRNKQHQQQGQGQQGPKPQNPDQQKATQDAATQFAEMKKQIEQIKEQFQKAWGQPMPDDWVMKALGLAGVQPPAQAGAQPPPVPADAGGKGPRT